MHILTKIHVQYATKYAVCTYPKKVIHQFCKVRNICPSCKATVLLGVAPYLWRLSLGCAFLPRGLYRWRTWFRHVSPIKAVLPKSAVTCSKMCGFASYHAAQYWCHVEEYTFRRIIDHLGLDMYRTIDIVVKKQSRNPHIKVTLSAI